RVALFLVVAAVVAATRLAGQQSLEVVGRAAHVRDVQVRALLEADVDERGLHTGQYALDPTLVDVSSDAPLALALDVGLTKEPVFYEGNAGLGTVCVDHQEAMRHGPFKGSATKFCGARGSR